MTPFRTVIGITQSPPTDDTVLGALYLVICKALVSAAQLSGAQSVRSLCLSASGAQKLIDERERKLALIFALKMETFSLNFLHFETDKKHLNYQNLKTT